MATIIISCGENGGKDPDPEPTTTTLDKLQGTWNLSSVNHDGSDVTSDFIGFNIVISNTNYSITNGGVAWSESSGSMVINGGDNASIIEVMGGNKNISIKFSNEDKTLELSFNVPNTILGGGRLSGLAGNYVFTLTKN